MEIVFVVMVQVIMQINVKSNKRHWVRKTNIASHICNLSSCNLNCRQNALHLKLMVFEIDIRLVL